MVEEFSDVVLLGDLPEHRLRAGDVGVVVEVFAGQASKVPGYMVEFMTLTGETVAVVDVAAEMVRAVSGEDMPRVRSLARSG